MGIKTYLILMLVTTVVAWAGWTIVVTNIDPETAGIWGFVFFYASLFLSLLGTFSVLGFIARSLFYRRKRGHIYKVSTAFRQAVLWSMAIIVALALQAERLLVWWMIILLVFVFAMIELTLLVNSKAKEE